MPTVSDMLRPYPIPPVAKTRQFFCDTVLSDPETALRRQLEETCAPIRPGDRIAVTCGSRGIDQYVPLLRTIVDFVKSRGGAPFLVPSMGSHGGATAEGQAEVLRRFGITEAAIGAPVVSSMEVTQIGTTPKGLPVYIDKNACAADGIILFNRVKPHTSFRGKYESGLMKMLAIGLAKLPILCGVATIENGYSHLAEVHVLRREEILEKEPILLQRAWEMMPRIALDTIDVLIVCEIGKEISGTGMDTNIVGRFHTRAASGGPETVKLGVLNVTERSEGNANGMGLADFMPRHMYDQVDLETCYVNTLTSTEPSSTRIPMILANDKEVFQACVKLCGQVNHDDIRMVIIRSTKYLDEVYLSPAAVKAAVMPIEVTEAFQPVPFDADGDLTLFK